MPNIYPGNKKFEAILLYGDITLFGIILAIARNRVPPETSFLFVSFFLLIVLAAVEVFDVKAGFYAIFLFVALELIQGHFSVAAAYILVSVLYFLIRALRKRKFEKTTEREKHFRSLVDVSLQPMIIKNEKGEVLFASKSIKELLGIKKNLSTGKNIAEFIHPEDVHSYDIFLTQLLEFPNQKKSIELRLKKNENGWIWAKNDAINLLGHPDVKAIVGSWQDITYQKTVDFQKAELLRNETDARAIAEKAVRDRDEFLSIASHELKTPLTTVLLQLQATLRKILTQSLADFSGRDLLDSLQIAEKQSQSLAALIKDLLNVSLASTGRLTLTKEKANLSDMVLALAKNYSEEIKLSGCRVSIDIQDKEIIGNWDQVRLEQALTNLFMNALKYASGKKVTLAAKKEGGWGIFIIKDEGAGIPPPLQNKIFQPFQRANGNSSVKGLGVGLFITRQIALSHEGDISVESKPGKGTTFTLRLPLE